jgi:hypothetical protein
MSLVMVWIWSVPKWTCIKSLASQLIELFWEVLETFKAWRK